MKTCSKCGESKPLDQFGRDKRLKDGLRCYCKPCNNAYSSKWAAANPERHRTNVAKTRARNPARTSKWERECHWRRQQIDMDVAGYDKLLQKQGGVCAICKQPPGRIRLVVDHCHKTGRVRGLLHNACNRAIGYLKDDPALLEAARQYLL